jgi:hypothetical protein
LEEAIQLATAEKKELKALEKCRHGYSPLSSKDHNYCGMLALTFVKEYFRDLDRDMDNISDEVLTATEKQCPGVWMNAKKLELIKTFCLSQGTETIVGGGGSKWLDSMLLLPITWSKL